uniref:Uncharacterized protein n=1 Tax=Biomphalaria glabrata TaxID=6526 RepID=A0A2C9KJK9_BIOGL
MKISILIPAAQPADAGKYIYLVNAGDKGANPSAILTVAFSDNKDSQSNNVTSRPGYNQVINCVFSTETSTTDLYSEGIALNTCGTIVLAFIGVCILLAVA